MKISALIHTKNSGKTVERALASVKWADEIVVIDMHSKDDTVKICKEYTNNIFLFDDVGYVEPARNFGISKTTGDWVLILDADEELPEAIKDRLIEATQDTKDIWRLPRKNLIFGIWPRYASWWPDYQVRFFKKGQVTWPPQIHSQAVVEGEVGDIQPVEKYAIIHHNYDNVSQYVDRINLYTSSTIKDKSRKPDTAFESFWSDFIRKFFQMESYKDGTIGMHVSLLQAMYESILSIKHWEVTGKVNEKVNVMNLLDRLQQDLAYWRADYMVKHSTGVGQLYWRMRRKMKR